MPDLVVVCPGIASRTLALTKTQPVMIGSLEFNEIVVPGDDVPAVVCRVSWSGSAFEVTVAGAPSVSVNGADVARSELTSGDVITIGKVAIRYQDTQQRTDEKALPNPEAQSLSRNPSRKGQADKPAIVIEELSTSLSDLPTLPTRDDAVATRLAARAQVGSQKESLTVRPGSHPGHLKTSDTPPRPGEEDLLRSPFVLGMAICVGLLIVAGLVTMFLIQQRSLEREFSLAELDFKEGRFSQAYEGFQKFSTNHPRARRSLEARRYAWKAAIERELLGATPDYTQALSSLQKWIVDDRDAEDFASIRPDLLRAAERIATGSATASAASASAELLVVSDEATRLVERYNDDRTSLTASLERLEQLRKAATRALARQSRLESVTQEMQSAIKAKQALKALAIHRQLVDQYPDQKKNSQLNQLVADAILLEKQQVVERSVDALPLPVRPREAVSIMPYFHQRSRTDEATRNLALPLRLKDSIAALEPETGRLLWQFPLGESTDFSFALPLAGSAQRWLAYSERDHGLILFDPKQGGPLWLCPTGKLSPGQPAQSENSLFVSLEAGEIWRIDLDTGRITAAIQFPQKLVTQPVFLRNADYLAAGGEQSLLYTISRNPLQIVAATYLGHDKQTLTVPQLATGELLLVGENDQLDTGKVHVLATGQPDQSLPVKQTLELPGLLMGAGRIRGSTLVLPLVGERLVMFNVTDQPGTNPLTEVGGYPLRSDYDGPVELWFSPQDEVWMYGSRLKRFSVRPEGLSLLSGDSIAGWSAGVMTSFDRQVVIPRRSSWSTGVTTSTVNLAGQPGNWKTVAGGRLLAFVESNNRLLTASEAGILSTWTTIAHEPSSVFESQVAIDLPPLENWQLYACALPGKLVVASTRNDSAGASTQFWIYEGASTLPPSRRLEGAMELPPLPLDQGIVFFQNGLATWLNPQTGQKSQVVLPQFETAKTSTRQKSWISAAAFPNSVVAVTQNGELWKLSIVQGQLARVSTVKLPEAMVSQVARCGRYVAILLGSDEMQQSGQVQLYLEETLDPRATFALTIPESENRLNSIIGDENSLLVSTNQAIEHFDLRGNLETEMNGPTSPHRWKIPITGSSRIVAHFHDATIWIVTSPNQVQQIDRLTGKVLKTVETQIQIASLIPAFGKLFAASSDQALELIGDLTNISIDDNQQVRQETDAENRPRQGTQR